MMMMMPGLLLQLYESYENSILGNLSYRNVSDKQVQESVANHE